MSKALQVETHKGCGFLTPQQSSLPFYIVDAGTSVFQKDISTASSGIFKDFVEIMWCTQGCGEVILQEKRWTLSENDTFFYLPLEDHAFHSLSDNWTLYWVCFNGPLAEAIMCSYRYPRCQHASESCPLALFEEFFYRKEPTDPSASALLCSKTLELIARMSGNRPKRLHPDREVDHVMNFIQKNLSNPDLSLDFVASALDISKSTLQKHFFRHTKISLGEYIRNERFQRAIALLQNTDLPIQEVAREVGYLLLPSFSRLIRRGTGRSPLELRQKNNQSTFRLSENQR